VLAKPSEMKTYTLLTDEVLADLIKAQDAHAYTELYQRYWGVLHRFCHRLLRDEAQAPIPCRMCLFISGKTPRSWSCAFH